MAVRWYNAFAMLLVCVSFVRADALYRVEPSDGWDRKSSDDHIRNRNTVCVPFFSLRSFRVCFFLYLLKRVVIVMVHIYLYTWVGSIRVAEAHTISSALIRSMEMNNIANNNMKRERQKKTRTRPVSSCFLQSYTYCACLSVWGEVRCGHKVPTLLHQTYYLVQMCGTFCKVHCNLWPSTNHKWNS